MIVYDALSREQLIEKIRLLELANKNAVGENPAGFIVDLINRDTEPAPARPVLKWVLDRDAAACLAVNQAALDYFALPRPVFLSLAWGEVAPLRVSAGQENNARPGVLACLKGGGELRMLQYCTFDFAGSDRSLRLVIASDISDSLQMADDLERTQEWLRRSQAYAGFGIWEWDVRNDVTCLSQQLASLFGCCDGVLEITRKRFLSVLHPDDRQRVADAILACVECTGTCANCREGFDVEYRIVRPDGSLRWMHDRGGVEQWADGRPARLLGVVQDVTEQRAAAQALRQSEQHFRLFAENVREMIWVASPRLNKLLYVSHACQEILGIPGEDLHKSLPQWEALVYPEDRPLVQCALVRQARGEAAEVEMRIMRPDGKARWIRVRSFPVRNGQGEHMISGIAEDVTDRKELEKERIAQMVAQRSNLVREVHHRIKNNLQGVAGLLRQHATDAPQVRSIIDRAIAQVQTVAVVHGLQGKTADNEVVLCEMVPTIARSVEAVLPSKPAIQVQVDVPRRIRVTEQETVPIALIVNELIMNAAKHAESDGGCIMVTVRWDRNGDRARISIANPGSLPEGFEFARGKGTGTGLDLVRSLLPPEGGNVHFSSENGSVTVVLELFAPSIYNF